MVRGLRAWAWLIVLGFGAGCVSPDLADQGELADGNNVRAEAGAAEVEIIDDDDGFNLSFVVDQRPPSVVVGHATVATLSAHRRPDAASPTVAELANPTKIGGPLVVQLVGAESDDGRWVEVLLPVRPNGTTGWVEREELELTSNPYRIEVDVSAFRLQVLKANEPWLDTTVAIGTGDTPTPIGRFYVIELLRPLVDGGPYGPFAFGLSGFSETLTNYAGGEGVIGIHGTDEPDSLGSEVSHGCVRMDNEVIEQLAAVLPLGTPVFIQP